MSLITPIVAYIEEHLKQYIDARIRAYMAQIQAPDSKTESPAPPDSKTIYPELNAGDTDYMENIWEAIILLANPNATVFTFKTYFKAIKALEARSPSEHLRPLLTSRYGHSLDEIQTMTAPSSRPSLFQFRHGVLMVERLWHLGLIRQNEIEGLVGPEEYKLMMSYWE